MNDKPMTHQDFYHHLPHLSPEELLVDVRTPEEYAGGHIPGSQNIPFQEIGDQAEVLKNYEKVYLYCRSGKRVEMALQLLKSQAMDHLTGFTSWGMLEWMEANYPIRTN